MLSTLARLSTSVSSIPIVDLNGVRNHCSFPPVHDVSQALSGRRRRRRRRDPVLVMSLNGGNEF